MVVQDNRPGRGLKYGRGIRFKLPRGIARKEMAAEPVCHACLSPNIVVSGTKSMCKYPFSQETLRFEGKNADLMNLHGHAS